MLHICHRPCAGHARPLNTPTFTERVLVALQQFVEKKYLCIQYFTLLRQLLLLL
jgi:hypothetical protein